MPQASVLVVGGINMDLVVQTPRFPEPGETVVGSRFTTTPGGKGGNQAVAAARMGARTGMVGRVGGDAFGLELIEALAAEGVDVGAVAIDDTASSGVALIEVAEAGQNRIVQVWGANATLGKREVEAALRALPTAQVVLLQMEVPPEVTSRVAREARRRGCTVVLDPAPAWEVPRELYRLADLLTPNETEATALTDIAVTDMPSAREAALRLLKQGALSVVVKLGAQGAYYAGPAGELIVPPFAVQAVDTVGAGDAFNGALAVALAEGLDMEQALELASAAAAIAVTRPGAQAAMPRRGEVEQLLAG